MEQLTMFMEKFEPLPTGEHTAKLADISEMDGPHGPMVRFHFSVNHEEDVHEVTGLANRKLNERSKLGRWITAILGREPEVGAAVKADDLIGKTCRVHVEHKTNNDGFVFANVAQVLTLQESKTDSVT